MTEQQCRRQVTGMLRTNKKLYHCCITVGSSYNFYTFLSKNRDFVYKFCIPKGKGRKSKGIRVVTVDATLWFEPEDRDLLDKFVFIERLKNRMATPEWQG
jgi:hypothetical protein